MAFRILHTSDWHLGQHFYGKSRANEHQQFIDWLLEQVKKQQIDAVIVAGDIFDTGTPPSYAREMYFNFIVALSKLNCSAVILAGNHDSVAMLNESSRLLNTLNCHVVVKAQDIAAAPEQLIYLENAQQEKAVVCAVPFIRPRDILQSTAGQSAKEKQQQLQHAIAEHYQQLVKAAKAKIAPNTAVIATGHLTTVGASCSDSVRDIYIGTLDAFPASEFPNVDYLALGHIHRPQIIGKQTHIRYCGSPIPLSFDETAQAKSVNMVCFEQGKMSACTPIEIPMFQAMATVKTSLEQLEDKVADTLAQLSLEGDDKLWLDIELSQGDYLLDLTARVQEILADYPVDILLVRKAKKSRLNMSPQDKVTLEELKVDDVFQARLALEDWSNEDDLKQRLTLLFNQAVEQCEQQNSDENEQAEVTS
ncbi:exonuclease subunit SbcD [Thalassotalea sp. 1_MG-2023]|uniref:exonuclease subunit SbcD n=1 Tax=Thalassotalea sp. 1_MG-2023 TaxID=3062680 RepID=UPI0026E18B4A|nr:exonuclease subunit SbcD [Thalassotalea sp. 1_MG-2023]MDO6428231.1 exonuclease subunit SbcD [Thalassotalea sp. 1_MG-2023]